MQNQPEIWRVVSSFSHLDEDIIYQTTQGKLDAYEEVANLLMTENILRVMIYQNGQLTQLITVS